MSLGSGLKNQATERGSAARSPQLNSSRSKNNPQPCRAVVYHFCGVLSTGQRPRQDRARASAARVMSKLSGAGIPVRGLLMRFLRCLRGLRFADRFFGVAVAEGSGSTGVSTIRAHPPVGSRFSGGGVHSSGALEC